MNHLLEYISVIQECEQQCQNMLALESEKRRALTVNDAPAIEAALKKQQAALMKLEIMEKKRMETQQALGFDSSMTAAQIIAQLPDSPEKTALEKAARSLKECAQEVQLQNRESIDLAKLDLRLIESLQAKNGNQSASNAGLYTAGKPPANPIGKTKFNSSF